MANDLMMAQMSGKEGFIAALDQSGGSTPGALRHYGIPDGTYNGDADMFRLIHEMRVRIITAPAFTGDKVIGAILFEGTMDGEAGGKPVPTYLWEERGIVPFVKVDKGLEAEKDGVKLMKPMPGLETLLARAVGLGVFGTKMRSVIERASKTGIGAIVDQQFAVADADRDARPDADHRAGSLDQQPGQGRRRSHSAGADQGEARRPSGWAACDAEADHPDRAELLRAADRAPACGSGRGLSGGYSRSEACAKLAANRGMIASFSRALIDDLRHDMSDAEFNATLARAIDEIYRASTMKS